MLRHEIKESDETEEVDGKEVMKQEEKQADQEESWRQRVQKEGQETVTERGGQH